MEAGKWTWLEVAEIGVGALTPLLLFVLGLLVTRAARRVEEAQWASRKIVEKRLDVYGDLAPRLNDIFCFFTRVGHYAAVTPPDVIAAKRDADKIFFVHAPLFSPSFDEAYHAFIDTCFRHFAAVAQPAKLRTDPDRQRAERLQWDPQWDALFDATRASTDEDVHAAYGRLMRAFADEVGARTAPAARA